MTESYRRSLTDVAFILSCMDEEYFKRIPVKFLEFLKKNKSYIYTPEIDVNIPLNEQTLSKDTKVILSILYRLYWK